MFIGHPDAGQRCAIIYALLESCKRHGINPQEYLRDVLSRLPSMTGRQPRSLTPASWLDVIKNYVALNGAFATDDQDSYLDAWQSVDSDDVSPVVLAKEEGVPLAVAKRVFGQDPKPIIEELNDVLVA